MKSRFSIWAALTLAAALLPGLYLASRWPSLPAMVPTHFDLHGQANGYSSKAMLLWLVGAPPLLTYLLLHLLPRFDPKRGLDPTNPNWPKLRLVVQLLLAGVGCFVVWAAGGGALGAAQRPALAGLLGLFALLGNYLSTVPPNYFVGIRTPWTLESPLVWAKTHRLAGRLFFAGGLLGLVLVLLLPVEASVVVVVGVLGGVSLVAVGYSWWAGRQLAN